MNYYNEIKEKLIDNEAYLRVKEYSKERHKVITYFEIGKLLNEAGGKYGDKIIGEYSKKLDVEVGKKYNRRTLFRMKQFYNVFSNEKVSPLVTQLTWTHYRENTLYENEIKVLEFNNNKINKKNIELTNKINGILKAIKKFFRKLLQFGSEIIKEVTVDEIKQYFDDKIFKKKDVVDISVDTTKEDELFNYVG